MVIFWPPQQKQSASISFLRTPDQNLQAIHSHVMQLEKNTELSVWHTEKSDIWEQKNGFVFRLNPYKMAKKDPCDAAVIMVGKEILD